MPRIKENNRIYNQVLKEVFKEEFLENAYSKINVEKLWLEDNHHLSVEGHKCLSQEIIGALETKVQKTNNLPFQYNDQRP